MRGFTLTQVSAAAVDSWEALLSQATHMAHCPQDTTRLFLSLLGKTQALKKHTQKTKQYVWMTCIWCRLTRDDCAEGEVTDAPLSADCCPRWLAWMVVLHHQRETAPGEVGAHMLLAHHHTHTVTHAVGTGWECDNKTLLAAWYISF